jgi:hypothetical protein
LNIGSRDIVVEGQPESPVSKDRVSLPTDS